MTHEMHKNEDSSVERPIKWGSGTDRAGHERVVKTAVEGEWEDRWEELGRQCWAQMESLRQEWEERLGGGDAE